MSVELIALASSGIALIVSVGALWLDVRIIRHQEDHYGLLRDLHHHHIVKPGLNATIEDGPSAEPGHGDCHGPVYRSGGCDHLCDGSHALQDACARCVYYHQNVQR